MDKELMQLNQTDLDIIKDGLDNIVKQHKDVSKIKTPKGLIKKVTGFDYGEKVIW